MLNLYWLNVSEHSKADTAGYLLELTADSNLESVADNEDTVVLVCDKY